MQWSQLKQRVEAQFAPSIQGRVQVWVAVYRKPATTDGRGWLTLDGVQLFSMTDRPSEAAMRALYGKMQMAEHAAPGSPASDWTRQPEYYFTHHEFRSGLADYLQTGIEDLLTSTHPLLRGLAMLDRRLGKRRFQRLTGIGNEHPFVQRLHRIRSDAEAWPLSQPEP